MIIDKNIKIDIPKAVEEILYRLHSHGYEAYIVGGCVRDALLKRDAKDWDITTSALPLEVKELFRNTVDTGIQHGTVMVIKNGEGYEVTTYRVDGEYKDGRHPSSVTFTRSLSEDLKRRDFTINAFAWDDNGLIDLFDGLSDLKNGIIRCVGNPDERFNEDALRIMRAVRFSAQLGFEIEPETKAMISKYKERLKDISRERIRVEFEKTLISDNPSVVNMYGELGLAEYIIDRGSFKCFDGRENDLINELLRRKIKAISKDVWIYDKYIAEPEEFYRFLIMAAFMLKLSPEEANSAFKSLRYDNRTREAVVKIIQNKELLISTDRVELKLLLNRLGIETLLSVLELKDASICICKDAVDQEKNRSLINRIEQEILDIFEKMEPWCTAHLAVNGSDLISAGIPAGKKIGETLGTILLEVIKEPALNDKNILCDRDFLARIAKED